MQIVYPPRAITVPTMNAGVYQYTGRSALYGLGLVFNTSTMIPGNASMTDARADAAYKALIDYVIKLQSLRKDVGEKRRAMELTDKVYDPKTYARRRAEYITKHIEVLRALADNLGRLDVNAGEIALDTNPKSQAFRNPMIRMANYEAFLNAIKAETQRVGGGSAEVDRIDSRRQSFTNAMRESSGRWEIEDIKNIRDAVAIAPIILAAAREEPFVGKLNTVDQVRRASPWLVGYYPTLFGSNQFAAGLKEMKRLVGNVLADKIGVAADSAKKSGKTSVPAGKRCYGVDGDIVPCASTTQNKECYGEWGNIIPCPTVSVADATSTTSTPSISPAADANQAAIDAKKAQDEANAKAEEARRAERKALEERTASAEAEAARALEAARRAQADAAAAIAEAKRLIEEARADAAIQPAPALTPTTTVTPTGEIVVTTPAPAAQKSNTGAIVAGVVALAAIAGGIWWARRRPASPAV